MASIKKFIHPLGATISTNDIKLFGGNAWRSIDKIIYNNTEYERNKKIVAEEKPNDTYLSKFTIDSTATSFTVVKEG